METLDAIKIIETILESMRNNPAQFQFSVTINTIGAMGVGGQGGHGIVATANAPGSVGFSAFAPSKTTIQIAEQQANKELNNQFSKIEKILQEIINNLHAATLTEEKKNNFMEQLKKSWLPNVIVSIISLILGKVIG